jgi:uncharacterized protein (TIRG00374 family)
VRTDAAHAELPAGFETRRLVRRGVEIALLIGALVLVALLAPGLGEVRDRLDAAKPAWLAVAVLFELLSCFSYVMLFGPVFCRRMSWRTSNMIGWSELGVGSLVPASGAGGLALGAWILRRRGMPADRIARRSVAFFLIKSSVNFVAVAVVGALIAAGILGPPQPAWLTIVPAALAAAVIGVVVLLPRIGRGADAPLGASRTRRLLTGTRRAVIDGTAEALQIVRTRDLLVVAGAIGYWAWDNAVLWATFHALGPAPPISIILMGYLIGQLGGLLPLPGGVGGIDGGLIGALVVYGAPAATTAAAVLIYRVILFWLPLLGGAIAFAALKRSLDRTDELA